MRVNHGYGSLDVSVDSARQYDLLYRICSKSGFLCTVSRNDRGNGIAGTGVRWKRPRWVERYAEYSYREKAQGAYGDTLGWEVAYSQGGGQNAKNDLNAKTYSRTELGSKDDRDDV